MMPAGTRSSAIAPVRVLAMLAYLFVCRQFQSVAALASVLRLEHRRSTALPKEEWW